MPPYDHYDFSRIVEYYPRSLNRVPGNLCTISVRTCTFERYIFRPIDGHDILKRQIPIATYPGVQHDSYDYDGYPQEELCRRIGYDLHDYDSGNWGPFAAKMSVYIRESEIEMGEQFKLEADEAQGKLYVWDERKGWSDDSNEQRTTDTCAICLDNISDQVAARMGLPCGHVFDKECLTEWIWTKPHCPICREPLPNHEN